MVGVDGGGGGGGGERNGQSVVMAAGLGVGKHACYVCLFVLYCAVPCVEGALLSRRVRE